MRIKFTFVHDGEIQWIVRNDIDTSVERIDIRVTVAHIVQTANGDVVLVTTVTAHLKVIVSIVTHVDIEVGRIRQFLVGGISTFQHNSRSILVGNSTLPTLGDCLIVRIDSRRICWFTSRYLHILVRIVTECFCCLLVVQDAPFILHCAFTGNERILLFRRGFGDFGYFRRFSAFINGRRSERNEIRHITHTIFHQL